jgi:hypothetical protein
MLPQRRGKMSREAGVSRSVITVEELGARRDRTMEAI